MHRLQQRGHWRGRPARLFFRFFITFGFLALLIIVLLGLPFFIFSFDMPGPAHMRPVWRGGSCLTVLLFIFFVTWITRRVFSNIAAPLGDVMEAADAVAGGDLSARVPVSGGGVFRRLGDSFNRMAGEIERADRQRRRLTADVAHELRNPLHVIRGNLEGVLDGVYLADEEHIRNTLDETRLLARLVDDLQTLSLAEAGQLRLHFENVNVGELLSDTLTSFSGQAEALGIDLKGQGKEDGRPLEVRGDYERLLQVLANLVANALNHTPPGGRITLAADAVLEGVRITVTDTGNGIPPEDLPMIFERFWKGDRARTRKEDGGSGLGLSICRQLVRSHGGAIVADSMPGEGTQFTITLPGAGESA